MLLNLPPTMDTPNLHKKQFLLEEIQKLAKRFTHIGWTISTWKRTKEPEILIIKPIHTAQKHATRRKFPTLQLFPEKLRVWMQHLVPQLLTNKVTVLDEFARLHSVSPSRHSTERTDRNIHLPVFPWKRHICQLQKLLPEGQASNLTHVEAVIPPQETGEPRRCHLHVLSLAHNRTPVSP